MQRDSEGQDSTLPVCEGPVCEGLPSVGRGAAPLLIAGVVSHLSGGLRAQHPRPLLSATRYLRSSSEKASGGHFHLNSSNMLRCMVPSDRLWSLVSRVE